MTAGLERGDRDRYRETGSWSADRGWLVIMTTKDKGKAKASTKIDNIGSAALILRTSNGITGAVDNFQRKLKEIDSGTTPSSSQISCSCAPARPSPSASP